MYNVLLIQKEIIYMIVYVIKWIYSFIFSLTLYFSIVHIYMKKLNIY